MGQGIPASSTTPANEKPSPPVPFHSLDDKTKSKLKQLRHQVPRYLFRAWKNTYPRMSGGYSTLNTPDHIIPLAFCAGRGHSNVYDMSKTDLTNMVVKHIRYERDDFLTEFSSWTASLSFAMLFFPPEDMHDVYISIIDTQAHKSHNDMFFVPDLAFLTRRGNLKKMHHEYLAHGPIRGTAYRAVPLSVFHEAGFDRWNLHTPGKKLTDHQPRKVTISEVQRARSVGEQYGYQFAVPVTLALLCLEERTVDLFLREGDVDRETVIRGLYGIRTPQNWSQDTTIMEDVVFMGNYFDIRQFIHLMRAIVRQQVRNMHVQNSVNRVDSLTKDEMSSHDAEQDFKKHPEYKWFVRFANGKARIVERAQETVRKNPATWSIARVAKSSDSRMILKLDSAALESATKKLDINMNRHGGENSGNGNKKKAGKRSLEIILG